MVAESTAAVPYQAPSAPRPARAGKTRARGQHTRAAVGFLAPFGVLFTLFYLVPIGYAIWRSLHRIERSGGIYGVPHEVFAGLSQYGLVFTSGAFGSSVLRVVIFGVVQVPIMLAISLGLALLLDSTLARFKRFFRIAFFLPYGIPGVIAALMWGFIYSPSLSPILGPLSRAGIAPDFLGADLVLWSIANVVTWTYIGYNMLIIFSALQAIPPQLFEAAKLDGATNWDIARRIKIPSVFPALILTTVFSIIGTLQLFTEPIVFSQIATTITSNYTPNMFVFTASQNNYDYAAATSVVLALATFILSFAFLRATQRRASQ